MMDPLVLLKPVDVEVRGEAYWRLSSFLAYNSALPESDRYANPRNGMGVMRQRDSKEVAKCRLDFVAYSIPTDNESLCGPALSGHNSGDTDLA